MPELIEARKIWETIYERFDPQQPAVNDDWRVERKYSPARDIVAELARPMGGPKRFMILGGLGSGKSTELHGIAQARSESGPVVFIDLLSHFETRVGDEAALEGLEPWEVILLAGLAVFRAGEAVFDHEWPKELRKRFQAAGEAFGGKDESGRPTFDLAKLSSAVLILAGGAVGAVVGGPVGAGVGAGLVSIGEAGKSIQWRFPLGLRNRATSEQDPRIQVLLDAVNSLIGNLQNSYHWKLTLFIDGPDRIKSRERVEALFVDSSLIGMLACDVVTTGPMTLHWGSLRKHVRKFTTKTLANAPVISRSEPRSWEPGGAGIELCLEVYRRRTAGLPEALIPEPLLRKIAYYSGGRMREFIRLIRETSGPAWDDGLEQASESAVEKAIEVMRMETEGGINSRHMTILRALLANPDELPDDELVSEMLNVSLILPYPNQSEWFYPHPLLLKAKLPKPSG